MTEDKESRSNDFWFILLFTMLLLIYLNINPPSLEFLGELWSTISNAPLATKIWIWALVGVGVLTGGGVIYIAIIRRNSFRSFLP